MIDDVFIDVAIDDRIIGSMIRINGALKRSSMTQSILKLSIIDARLLTVLERFA